MIAMLLCKSQILHLMPFCAYAASGIFNQLSDQSNPTHHHHLQIKIRKRKTLSLYDSFPPKRSVLLQRRLKSKKRTLIWNKIRIQRQTPHSPSLPPTLPPSLHSYRRLFFKSEKSNGKEEDALDFSDDSMKNGLPCTETVRRCRILPPWTPAKREESEKISFHGRTKKTKNDKGDERILQT